MSTTVTSTPTEVVIKPPGRSATFGIGELWNYRELLYFMTKRELQIRYKQSIVGVLWAFLQPVLLAFIFALFFGLLAKVPSDGVPYPVFAMAGLVPWVFVSQSVSQSASSLVGDANLLSKVYFPRMVLPIARILALLLDLLIASLVLVVFMVIYGVALRPEALFVPVVFLLGIASAVGFGVVLSAINVQYRDVAVAIPLMMQVWLFATPVIYPGGLITGNWQYVYALNPMVTVIGGVRAALFGVGAPSAAAVGISITVVIAVLVRGLRYFRRSEYYFADVV